MRYGFCWWMALFLGTLGCAQEAEVASAQQPAQAAEEQEQETWVKVPIRFDGDGDAQVRFDQFQMQSLGDDECHHYVKPCPQPASTGQKVDWVISQPRLTGGGESYVARFYTSMLSPPSISGVDKYDLNSSTVSGAQLRASRIYGFESDDDVRIYELSVPATQIHSSFGPQKAPAKVFFDIVTPVPGCWVPCEEDPGDGPD